MHAEEREEMSKVCVVDDMSVILILSICYDSKCLSADIQEKHKDNKLHGDYGGGYKVSEDNRYHTHHKPSQSCWREGQLCS